MTEPALPRTVSKLGGISPEERGRLTEAVALFRGHGYGGFVSVMHDDEGTVRDLTREVSGRGATAQKRAGMRSRHSLRVFEARPKLGSHIIIPFNSRDAAQQFVNSLNSSQSLMRYGLMAVWAEVVNDRAGGWNGLAGYLLKEMDPRAWYGTGKKLRRIKGSAALGEGGGDRVILSRDTEAALVRSGRIEPRQRTYASRSISRPSKSKRARALVAGENQLVLFPQVAKPVHRLHEFTEGYMPEVVATEVAFLMRQKGLSQQALAGRAAMSRQRIGNILRGRFGATEWTVTRIREVLAAA